MSEVSKTTERRCLVSVSSLWQRYSNTLVQFIKFGIIGGAGVGVNLLAIVVANNVGWHVFAVHDYQAVLGLPGTAYSMRLYHVYALIAFLVANLFNFVWNRYWTFKSADRAPFAKEFMPFLLVGSIAQAVGLVILTLLRNPTSPFYLGWDFFTDHGAFYTKRAYWAQLIQVVLVMPINFVVNKLWTFRAVRVKHSNAAESDG